MIAKFVIFVACLIAVIYCDDKYAMKCEENDDVVGVNVYTNDGFIHCKQVEEGLQKCNRTDIKGYYLLELLLTQKKDQYAKTVTLVTGVKSSNPVEIQYCLTCNWTEFNRLIDSDCTPASLFDDKDISYQCLREPTDKVDDISTKKYYFNPYGKQWLVISDAMKGTFNLKVETKNVCQITFDIN